METIERGRGSGENDVGNNGERIHVHSSRSQDPCMHAHFIIIEQENMAIVPIYLVSFSPDFHP